MTTHDKDKIIAAAKEANGLVRTEGNAVLQWQEYFYAIAFEDGRQAEREERAFLQSRIDELMLEYCPNEMTEEQLANWAAHQRPVDESELPEAIRARSTK